MRRLFPWLAWLVIILAVLWTALTVRPLPAPPSGGTRIAAYRPFAFTDSGALGEALICVSNLAGTLYPPLLIQAIATPVSPVPASSGNVPAPTGGM